MLWLCQRLCYGTKANDRLARRTALSDDTAATLGKRAVDAEAEPTSAIPDVEDLDAETHRVEQETAEAEPVKEVKKKTTRKKVEKTKKVAKPEERKKPDAEKKVQPVKPAAESPEQAQRRRQAGRHRAGPRVDVGERRRGRGRQLRPGPAGHPAAAHRA